MAFSHGSNCLAVEIQAMSDIEKSAKNVVEGFRVLRRFCRDVSLLLNESNKMMEEDGWTRISKRTPAIETSGGLDNPDCWLPDAFFCFYEQAKKEHLLPYISVHVDDLEAEDYDPDCIKEPIISAGWLDFGVGKKAVTEWCKNYWICYSHLWMENRKDDGTPCTDDLWKISEVDSFPSGTVNVTAFAHPLEVVINSETLKEKIVQPLLNALPK
jgi:hypothetical protein